MSGLDDNGDSSASQTERHANNGTASEQRPCASGLGELQADVDGSVPEPS